MNENTVTRRHALTTIGGSIMAVAAAATLPTPAPVPLRTLERVDIAAPQPYAAALFAFAGEAPFLVVNTLVATSQPAQAAVERWAGQQRAGGSPIALLDAAELRALA